MQDSAQIFRANLEQLLTQYGNYENLAQKLEVPISTLKSWINGLRTPSLKAIARLANRLGCHASALIMPYSNLKDQGIHHNDTHKALVQNLNIIFIDKQCYSLAQKLFLLDNEVSEFTLMSYMRNSNYRLPTLSGLDRIAEILQVSACDLLKEESR